MTHDVLLAPADNVRLIELCGPLDEHLRLIETRLGVEVRRRGNRFQLIGLAPAVGSACRSAVNTDRSISSGCP